MRLVLVLMLMCGSVPFAHAATISGTIYDFTLQPVQDARLSVNTTPSQFFVAADGTYSFDVANGNYHLRAERYDGSTLVAFEEKNFSVKRPGEYVVDFIVFPDFEADQALAQDLDQDLVVLDEEAQSKSLLWIIIFLLMMLIGIVLYYVVGGKEESKHTINSSAKQTTEDVDKSSASASSTQHKSELHEQKKEPPSPTEKDSSSIVIDVLQKHGGRATQKDIRKDIPLSEAKISLMIAELESQGKIKKIKKGRGNIIVLSE